ncbi:MAG: tRNA (adenosine(37)-N6)-threonylcarbamoyltransferase complex dimerization subunit type 1 TsaB [Clostridiales bacterium]|nr:tRNA (adenosine(37)-N6)-threonylcarbamoyltransferase complex dimerization subunit type 1 TsaB [Clostridiales bacterium]
MLLLACDTSDSTCCAGIYRDGEELAYELSMEKKTHSETFMPLVARVFEKSNVGFGEIDRIAITVGPGSFTGIRIGMSAVLGMAAASERKIETVPVSSTLALAYSVENVSYDRTSTCYIPCFDARNMRVFAQATDADTYETLMEEDAYNASDIAKKIGSDLQNRYNNFIVVGSGADAMSQAIEENCPFINVQYAKGAVILPRGIAKAAERSKAVPPEELKARYCAVSRAERYHTGDELK